MNNLKSSLSILAWALFGFLAICAASDTVNSTSISGADDELCPECGRPRITPKDVDAFSTTTLRSGRGAHRSSLLRHSDTSSASSGKFSIPWVENYPVWVQIYDGLGGEDRSVVLWIQCTTVGTERTRQGRSSKMKRANGLSLVQSTTTFRSHTFTLGRSQVQTLKLYSGTRRVYGWTNRR